MIHCDPENIVVLASAQFGLYEYLSSLLPRQPVGPELISCYISAWLKDISIQDSGIGSLDVWKREFKTLEVLFSHDTSSHYGTALDWGPAFHAMLQSWCIHNPPQLAVIAFLLFYGANPRFTVELSEMENGSPLRGNFYKSHFNSGFLAPESRRVAEDIHFRKLDNDVYVVPARGQISRVNRRSNTIGLVDLASFWFSDQSHILKPVINWIMKLAAPVEPRHRSRLQDKFENLRPLFDPYHPDFVGWGLGHENRSNVILWKRYNRPPEATMEVVRTPRELTGDERARKYRAIRLRQPYGRPQIFHDQP
ncbi:uncharacterized protein F4822DRAFT_403568 [Hypoxylon trugodes]|uniref:uncharacterized protein n=1 Tax=Hypoxylon trugodes TaxID=326681 RepID=UPI0021935453|nr:uncharacterized protein F4822DRAFT_403568 [Hypoxylon trugodes]KAI1388691.1 hypothetical protein F4822DRAFT_403568 [Hypoxylon trugodes]